MPCEVLWEVPALVYLGSTLLLLLLFKRDKLQRGRGRGRDLGCAVDK